VNEKSHPFVIEESYPPPPSAAKKTQIHFISSHMSTMSVNESTDTDPEIPAASPSCQLSYAEQNYIEKNQCMKSLVVMCRGLLDEDGKQLLDPTSDPWKFFKPAATVKPLADDYKQEIERHWNYYIKDSPSGSVASAPCPKAWPMNWTLKFFDDNPIPAQDDIAFLKETVLLRKQQAYKTFDCQRAKKRNWRKVGQVSTRF